MPKTGSTPIEYTFLKSKPFTTWSVSEVASWLDVIGCTECKVKFIENQISGADLFDLSDADMTTIQIKEQKRRVILDGIAQLRFGADHSSSTSSISEDTTLDTDSSDAHVRVVKCVLEGQETRLVRVAEDTKLRQLKKIIKKEFKDHHMSLSYRDAKGEVIAVRKENNWRDILAASPPSEPLRLMLIPKDPINKKELSFLESLVDGVIIIDPKGCIVFFNSSSERMFGYKREEVLNENVKKLMPVEYAEKHDSFLKSYGETGKKHVIGTGRPIIAQRRDGSTFSAFLSVAEVHRPGNQTFYTGTIKQSLADTQGQIENSFSFHAKYGVLENLIDSAIVIDEMGIIQFINREAVKVLGYQPAELIGRNVKAIMPNPFKSQHDEYIKNYIRSDQAKVLGIGRDVVAQCKNDTIIPVHLSISEHRLSDTKRIFTGILRRTERETIAEKSVLEQERDVLDNLVVPAIIIDHKGTINAFNRPCQELLGFSLIEVIGKNVKVLMPSPEKENHDRYLSDYLKTGKAKVLGVGRDVIAIHKNGTMVPVRLSVTSRKTESDNMIFTGILQDLR